MGLRDLWSIPLMKPRPISPEKAQRLLVSGQVRLTSVLTGTDTSGKPTSLKGVKAIVQGDSGTYNVTFAALPVGWVCTCPAKMICSHILAVVLVTGTGE